MNKDALLTRKANAERQRDTMIANAQMCAGVIQDCEFWLKELEKAEAEAAKPAEETPKEATTNG